MSTRRFVDLGRVIFCAASILGIFSTQPVLAGQQDAGIVGSVRDESGAVLPGVTVTVTGPALQVPSVVADRKSTRLNSSHVAISYAVFCLKKKNYKSVFCS